MGLASPAEAQDVQAVRITPTLPAPEQGAGVPPDWPVATFSDLVARHGKPAPTALQVRAAALANQQLRSHAERVAKLIPDTAESALQQQDAAYMLRLTELAARELAAGHGLLVIHGVAPDLSSSRQHFYLVPAIETQFDRMVGVLVDIDGLRDAELMAYDQACRELRQQASLGRANAFNQRPDAERHEAVRQFLERQSTKGLLDWTLFGLQSGDGGFVTVDPGTAMLRLR